MQEMKKSAIKLLNEVMDILKKKGFKFKETINKENDVIMESEPTESGNNILLQAIGDYLLPTIVGNKYIKETIVDNTIRRIMAKKFDLTKIIVENDTLPNALDVADTIVNAFLFYENAWEKMKSEKDLAPFINGAHS